MAAWAGESDAQKLWPWLVPLTAGHITQFFKGGFSGSGENGIDLGMPMGRVITSLTAGTVLTNGYYGGGGVVTVQSTLPLGIGVASVYYQHLDLNNPAMTPGHIVKVGDVIGWSGGQLQGGHHPSSRQFSSGPHIEIGINAPFNKNGLWHPLGPNINPLPWLQDLVAHGPGTTDVVASAPNSPVQGVPQAITATVRGTGPVANDFMGIEQRWDSMCQFANLQVTGTSWTDWLPWNWGNINSQIQNAEVTVGRVVFQDIEAFVIRATLFMFGVWIVLLFLYQLMKPAVEAGVRGAEVVGGAAAGAALLAG